MNEEQLYLLLNVIAKNSSVKVLIRGGISYGRIAQLTRELIESGLLIYSNEKVMLSEAGNARLKDLQSKFKKTNKEEWIKKDEANMIPKLNTNTIFVPSQKELTFLVHWKDRSSKKN